MVASIRQIIRSRYRKLAKARTGESLEDFAKHFAGRQVPREVLEAVYQAFSEASGVLGFPVRATDEVDVVYGLVEHFDDFLDHLLTRSGRHISRDALAAATGRLKNVEDVVLFISSCPTAA